MSWNSTMPSAQTVSNFNQELLRDFYITQTYALVSIVMYFLVAFVIFKHKKIFRGSYYNIILFDAAINVFTYLNSLYAMQLPKITCKKCLLAPFYELKYWGMSFFACMTSHMAYVQYLMILSLIFNRFTAVIFPVKHETIWKFLLVPFMLFNYLAPFIFTYTYFTATVVFFYTDIFDQYFIFTYPDVSLSAGATLIPFMVVMTIISTILMIVTFTIFSSRYRRDAGTEKKLLIYSAIYFLIQIFATCVVIAINVGIFMKSKFLFDAGSMLLPYVTDALTFCSPYLLIFCSPTMRQILAKMIFRGRLFGKNPEPSSIVVVT